MIALLAAVPGETEQLQAHLSTSPAGYRAGQLAGQDVVLNHSGVGKANAAASATELILKLRPAAIILLGCGGAYLNSGLGTGDLAVASAEIFGDEGSLTPSGFCNLEQLQLPLSVTNGMRQYNDLPLNPSLCKLTTKVLEGFAASQARQLKTGPFVTVSTCSGTSAGGAELQARTGGICENMEGAAVALVCDRHQVPLIEIRGISNLVEDRDLTRWDLPAATAIAQAATLCLLNNWPKIFGS